MSGAGGPVAEIYVTLVAIGAAVVVLTSLSALVRRSLVSESLLALGVGVLLGPAVLGLVVPTEWVDLPSALEGVAGFIASVALMEVGLRVPVGYLQRRWRVPLTLLGPVTLAMWVVSSLLVHLITGMPLLESAMIGAAISPTDPVIASSIVSGKLAERLLPERVRSAISSESGANDGVAYPFMLLPILLLATGTSDALLRWAFDGVLLHVVGGLVLGGIVGYVGGRLLGGAERRHTGQTTDFIAYVPGLLIFELGVSRLLPINGFLAVFASGVAFQVALGRVPERAERATVSAVARVATVVVFLLLGSVLPWQQWFSLGWRGPVLVVAVLVLRRVPAVLAARRLLRRELSVKDALFIGWFGPIGVGAVYYAGFAWGRTGDERVWVVVSLIVAASVLVHGASAAPLMRLYARSDRR